MPGDFGFPYRAPCGGWPAKPKVYLGGCQNNVRKSEKNIPRWRNVSKVDDYHRDSSGDPVEPGGIAPYTRSNDDNTDHQCVSPTVPSDCRLTGTNCFIEEPDNQRPRCCQWPISERPAFAGPGQVYLDYNVYQRIAEETLDFSLCRKLGFKLVQARKAWHGRFAYDSPDFNSVLGQYGQPILCEMCECEYPAPVATADQTKYRTLDASSEVEMHDASTALETRNVTVGRLSGVLTLNSCGDESTGASAVSAVERANTNLIRAQNAKWSDLVALYCDLAEYATPGTTFTETGSGGVRDWEWRLDADNSLLAEGHINVPGGTASQKRYDFPFGSGAPLLKEETLVISGTEFHWTRSTPVNGFYDSSWKLQEVIGTLDDAYTAADVYFDLVTLLATWNLADDVQYPWRTDPVLEGGPIVFYNEPVQAVIPSLPGDCDFEDPNAETYDGSLQGAPLPSGYGPHFDFDRQNKGDCFGTVYVRNFGKLNPGPSPNTATRWTDDITSQPLGPGGWWRHQVGGVAWAQKWAETIVPRPSYNFFGPWGRQRYALDEARTGCVDSVTGTGELGDPFIVTVAFSTAAPDFTDGEKVFYNGKIWTLFSHTDTEYTLTAPALYDVPAAAQPAGDVFGPLRFPNAWPVGGRVVVVSATQNGGAVDIVTRAPARAGDASWLRDDDLVDFSGVAGLAANLAVTVSDATHFSVPGTLIGPYVSGGHIKSSGAPGYEWFDTQRKGEFVTHEYQHDYRDYQVADGICARHNGFCVCDGDGFESVTCPGGGSTSDVRQYQAGHGMPRSVKVWNTVQRCIPFSPCHPQVICYSPNYNAETRQDKFPNGITINFGAFTADDVYGSAWQMTTDQHMPDPDQQNRETHLWQPPHKSCPGYANNGPSYSFNWTEANPVAGMCVADNDPLEYFYAHRPYLENKIEKPAGAPDLPDGVLLGYATWAELQSATTPEKPVAAPPTLREGVNNVPFEYDNTPWNLYLLQEICVCADGRFKAEYEANGVVC